MEKFKFILKLLLLPITAVWGFYFNVMVGMALIYVRVTENAGYALPAGIMLLVAAALLTASTVLIICDKKIVSSVLSVLGAAILMISRSLYLKVAFISSDTDYLFDKRNLPSLAVTAIVLIIAFINIYINKKRQKIEWDKQKAPSIFSKKQ